MSQWKPCFFSFYQHFENIAQVLLRFVTEILLGQFLVDGDAVPTAVQNYYRINQTLLFFNLDV